MQIFLDAAELCSSAFRLTWTARDQIVKTSRTRYHFVRAFWDTDDYRITGVPVVFLVHFFWYSTHLDQPMI